MSTQGEREQAFRQRLRLEIEAALSGYVGQANLAEVLS